MPKFKIVTGATGGTGHFFSMLGKDEIKINPGIFKKSITLDPASVTVSTEGLQPPSKNTVRFYLRHKGDEWVCDLTGHDFAKLQAMLLKYGYAGSTASARYAYGKVLFGGLVVLVLLMIFSGGDEPQSSSEKAVAEFSVQNSAAGQNGAEKTFDPGVMLLIEGAGWEKTRATWGAQWVKRINQKMPLAAKKVLASPGCDALVSIGYSDARSVPRKSVVFFADCKNGARYYVSEDDLSSETGLVSKQAQTGKYSDEAMILQCESGVRSKLSYPLSFDRHLLSTSVYRADTGNAVVSFVFDAKNALGAELPQKARCVFDDRGMSPPEITSR